MTKAVIDYESYYDKTVSVSIQGNTNYFRDADAYIVAATVGEEVWCGTLAEMGPTMEQIIKDPTVQCWAANSNFDQGFSTKYHGPSANDWQCILDLGRFNQMPGNLAMLSKVAVGKEMDKTTRDEMKGVRYEDLPEARQIEVQEYCIRDVIRSREILEAIPGMSPQEEKIAAHTRMMNRRGVHINVDLVETDKTKMEAMRFDAFHAIPWHADFPPLSYPALSRWCVSQNIPVPKSTAKTDEDCADLMSEHPALNEVLMTLRRFRKANTLIKKVETLLTRVSDAGVMPMDIIYCGAPHTRRWSSKGFNVQNLDKKPTVTRTWDNTDGTKGSESIWSRNWIIPPPGYEFLILDFAQVEPRCLNWLCGNDEMMEALRHGFSYYEAYYCASRGWKGEAGTLKKHLGSVDAYTKLKNEALGCGYGMGPKKYVTYANVEPAEAKKVVDGFRKLNPKVVSFWRQLDNLIISAARDKARHLGVTMPSGDLLQYFAIRAKAPRGYEGFVVKGDYGQASKQGSLWGGTLTENVTQRFARDVLAESVLRLEANGFPVAFHAHDEVILVVPIETNPKVKADVKRYAEQLTATPPDWCKTLPLGVEGDYASCYTKL